MVKGLNKANKNKPQIILIDTLLKRALLNT